MCCSYLCRSTSRRSTVDDLLNRLEEQTDPHYAVRILKAEGIDTALIEAASLFEKRATTPLTFTGLE